MKNINWFKVLIYTSLIFLIVTLYSANYLQIPRIYSVVYLSISFCLLFLGFIVTAYSWKLILRKDNIIEINHSEAIVSTGLSIFTKYIPGKLMVVLGRALYISKRKKIALKTISYASLKAQLIALWTGLFMGSFVMFKIKIDQKILIIGLVFFSFLTLFLFVKRFKVLLQGFVLRFLKKTIDYPLLSLRSTISILPSFILNWLAWCLSFYFLSCSLIDYPINVLSGFSFSLAGSLAIIAIISPGGLGVREGLLSVCLIDFGLNTQDAITISVASRLWFLVGEIFIFIYSLILNKKIQNEK
jgi:glycosyltransferase 2 family protein